MNMYEKNDSNCERTKTGFRFEVKLNDSACKTLCLMILAVALIVAAVKLYPV